MARLEVHALRKRLGDHLAVDDVSFAVEDGEFFVLLGPSGCGKSTTLRLICGLEQPDSGTITIGERDVTTLSPRERNVGMVFQEYGLYPSMDVFGNIAYGLEARGHVGKAEIRQRVEDAARKLGLTEMLRLPVTDLSGGEQQRIALGRAMVKDADTYLFDEPMSNLDPKLRHQVRRDIVTMHRAKVQSSLYVTHDQSEAFAMADTVGVMGSGQLQQVGTAQELIEQPASVFVAGFVGSPPMNLFPGSVVQGDAGPELSFAGISLRVRGLDALPAGGGAVTVGVRPEHLGLKPGTAAPDATVGLLTGRVEVIEPLLGEAIVRLRGDGDAGFTALFREGEEETLSVDDVVHLEVTGDQLHVFDSDSGEAYSR